MKVFILTGAGISADSGLKTFRDFDNGTWNNHNIEEVCNFDSFYKDRHVVKKFYDDMRKDFSNYSPNPAHTHLTNYMKHTKDEVMLVTQNIDNLHEQTGLHNVKHMHGSLYKIFCVKCGYNINIKDNNYSFDCEDCGAVESMRPDIVFFGEDIHYKEEIFSFLTSGVDVFIAIGTSGVVYPAAGFVETVNKKCDKFYVNKSVSDCHRRFNHKIIGNAKDTVPKLFEDLMNGVYHENL